MSVNPDKEKGRYVNCYVDMETWKKLTVLSAFADVRIGQYASDRLTEAVKMMRPSWETHGEKKKGK